MSKYDELKPRAFHARQSINKWEKNEKIGFELQSEIGMWNPTIRNRHTRLTYWNLASNGLAGKTEPFMSLLIIFV